MDKETILRLPEMKDPEDQKNMIHLACEMSSSMILELIVEHFWSNFQFEARRMTYTSVSPEKDRKRVCRAQIKKWVNDTD